MTDLRADPRVAIPQHESARTRVFEAIQNNAIVVALIVEIVAFSLLSDRFLSWANFELILVQTSIIGILAVPSAILLLSGYVDLGIGGTVGLVAVVVGAVLTDSSFTQALLIGFAVALAIGLFQGWIVTVLRFPRIVVGLGLLAGLRGLAFVVSGTRTTSRFGDDIAVFGRGRIVGLDVPVQVVVMGAFFLIGALYLYKTKWGRHTMAIGINRQAAFRAGLPIRGIPLALYCCTALSAGFVALIQLGRLDAAPPTIGEELELLVLSAVLLGGVSFIGGRGNLAGVAAGVLFIGVLNNGLLLNGVPAFWFRVSEGAALVLAAGVEAVSLRREERAQGLAPPRRQGAKAGRRGQR